MDTALIIAIAAAALLVLFLVARRGVLAAEEKRREKAGELRVEATRQEERARRAEVEAERQREQADARAARADKIDPDTETPGGRFGLFRRGSDEEADREREADERHEERSGLFSRLTGR